jgi:hypothetical protein
VLLGSTLGYVDGAVLVFVGSSLGCQLGSELGADESSPVGFVDGFFEGEALGATLVSLGLLLWETLGIELGSILG